MSAILDWIQQVTVGKSMAQVARAIGTTQATLWRQMNDDRVSPQHLVEIARLCGRPATEPLLLAGLITQDDLDAYVSARSTEPISLQQLSDEDLIKELSDRLHDLRSQSEEEHAMKKHDIVIPLENGHQLTLNSMTLAAKRGNTELESERYEDIP